MLKVPENPTPGQVVVVEDDTEAFCRHLALLVEGKDIGATVSIERIPNVSTMFILGLTVTLEPLSVGRRVTVQAQRLPAKNIQFVEFFGWEIHDYDHSRQEMLHSEDYEVVSARRIDMPSSRLYRYQRVCLKKLNKGESECTETP